MSDMQTIKQALVRAERTVTLRPERGRRVYRNVAVVREGIQCNVEEADQKLTLDVGKAVGGNDTGPTPSMVLRSAMSGCVAIGVKQWAARRDVPIDCVEVELETDVDARGQLGVCGKTVPGFEGIRLRIAVTSSAPRAVIDEVIADSLKYSPLMDVFVNPQSVGHRVTVIAPGADGQSMKDS